jgi:hypothetical protein
LLVEIDDITIESPPQFSGIGSRLDRLPAPVCRHEARVVGRGNLGLPDASGGIGNQQDTDHAYRSHACGERWSQAQEPARGASSIENRSEQMGFVLKRRSDALIESTEAGFRPSVTQDFADQMVSGPAPTSVRVPFQQAIDGKTGVIEFAIDQGGKRFSG